MHETGRLNDGSEIVYAAGLRIAEHAGVPAISHTGSTAGYRAFTARYRDQGLAVAMLCNVTNVPTGGTGARIARVFLGEASDPVEPAGVAVPRDKLLALTGLYREPDGFRAGGYIYRFRRDSSGRVVALSLSLGRVYDMRFERVHTD